jgi:hypothetical protein
VAKNDILTYEQVREMFDYDENTGILTWKIKHGHKHPGDEVGYMEYGYKILTIDKKDFFVHRIVWLRHYGKYPDQFIDHINGIRDDNRICNLRDVSQRENMHNKQRHREGRSLGVFYNQWEKRWDARIFFEHKQYRLGVYDTEELALQAYKTAQEEIDQGMPPVYRQPKNKYRKNKRLIPTNQKTDYTCGYSQKTEN